MGTSRSGKELAGKIAKAGYRMGQANRDATGAAALAFKDQILKAAKQDVGSDLSFSRFGYSAFTKTNRRRVFGAGYDVKGYTNAVAKLQARPQGMWKILNYGAGPHLIGAGKAPSTESVKSKGRAYRRAGKRYLYGGGKYTHPVRGPVYHPGTRGKGSWDRGVGLGVKPAKAVFAARHRRALAESFK